MAIKRDETTRIPDSEFLYDRIGRRGSLSGGLYRGGEIPLGIPIGRADRPRKNQRVGIPLGARVSTDLLDERQEPSLSEILSRSAKTLKAKIIGVIPTIGIASPQDKTELPVAAQRLKDLNAAKVMRVGLAAPPPHRIACNY